MVKNGYAADRSDELPASGRRRDYYQEGLEGAQFVIKNPNVNRLSYAVVVLRPTLPSLDNGARGPVCFAMGGVDELRHCGKNELQGAIVSQGRRAVAGSGTLTDGSRDDQHDAGDVAGCGQLTMVVGCATQPPGPGHDFCHQHRARTGAGLAASWRRSALPGPRRWRAPAIAPGAPIQHGGTGVERPERRQRAAIGMGPWQNAKGSDRSNCQEPHRRTAT